MCASPTGWPVEDSALIAAPRVMCLLIFPQRPVIGLVRYPSYKSAHALSTEGNGGVALTEAHARV